MEAVWPLAAWTVQFQCRIDNHLPVLRVPASRRTMTRLNDIEYE